VSMRRFAKPLKIAASSLCAGCFLMMAWAVVFHLFYTAFLAFLVFLVFLPLFWNRKAAAYVRAIVLTTAIVLIIMTFRLPIAEVNDRISVLAEKPRNDLASFTFRDKLGIYGLHLIMGIAARPVYPEISLETLMMIFPAPKPGVRLFRSSFAIHSEVVRKELQIFCGTALKTEKRREVRLKKRIRWSARDYTFGNKEARYALALNPAELSFVATQRGSAWKIEVALRVECRYPRSSSVVLLSNPELRVEEGLFWVLQQSGWLFPCTAEWGFATDSTRWSM
jgi:hypothetical protein